MEKLFTSKTFSKMVDGWLRTLILPSASAPGHKLQKPSKESGIFQSLGTISFALFYYSRRQSQKGGTRHNAPPPFKYAPV